jgi:2-iminobutanoate/2-iminopropanoate deaminase
MSESAKIVNSSDAPAPIGPYNQGRWAGNILYISGQIPLEVQSGEVITGDIEKATTLVMNHIGSILREAGLGFENVVKCSIFLTDMGHFAKVNNIYGRYFPEVAPAREAIQVAALPKGVEVEISAIACKT